MTKNEALTVLDEWTSVVDRTVAKVMSHCVQKFARRNRKKIILLSCHADVLEWLDPDWVVNCNTQKFIDRRLLPPNERERREKLEFTIRKIDKSSWRYFSKYHYLSDKIPGGFNLFFGLFHDNNQIGFQCFSNYVPHRDKKTKMILHSNRVVVHPDYAGMGLGIKMVTKCAEILCDRYKIMTKFSSVPMYRSNIKSPAWRLVDIKRQIGKTNVGGNMMRQSGFRENLKTYSFEFVGKKA